MPNRRNRFLGLVSVWVLTLLWAVLWGEGAVAELAGQNPPNAFTAEGSKPDAAPAAIAAIAAAAAPTGKASVEYHISAEETRQLFDEVDRIFEFVSKDTGLPLKSPVKKRIVTRKEVADYVETQLNQDESAKRLERSELVLKKFGLIPREFDLHKAFVKLLQDQVAAYYDPKSKTVNLLDWVPLDQQESVVAHELTHALQDQNFDLLKYEKEKYEDLPPSALDVSVKEVAADERGGAREAVVEGQAMVVMMDYLLRDEGTSVADAPSLVDAMKKGMETGDQSIAMAETPIFLKDSLTFPYFYGLDLVRYLLQREKESVKEKGGEQGATNATPVTPSALEGNTAPHISGLPLTAEQKARAFREPYRHPPETSYEVMNPEAWARGERFPVMTIAKFSALLKGKFERYDAGAIGAFDAHLLAKQYENNETADRVARGWRGGYYFAVHPIHALKPRLNLIFASQWKDEAAAAIFSGTYVRGLGQRYTSAQPDTAANGGPGVRRWKTEEGPVTIETQGAFVFVLEGFDDDTADGLRQALHRAAGLREEEKAGAAH